MRILCALDFSKTSLNAAKWINLFLGDLGGGEIIFVHCMSIQHRAATFNPMEDLLMESAKSDIQKLIEELKIDGNTYKQHTSRSDPKSYILEYATYIKADWIVTGTKGLTALKEMTIGSITDYFINESKVPVIAVPLESKYKKPENLVLGVDHKIVENTNILNPIKSITNVLNAQLTLLHVKTKKDSNQKIDSAYEIFFDDTNHKLDIVPLTESITEALNTYCSKTQADILVMIHHKRNWFQELFQMSTTKKELFDLHMPLIVLPE